MTGHVLTTRGGAALTLLAERVRVELLRLDTETPAHPLRTLAHVTTAIAELETAARAVEEAAATRAGESP